MDRRQTRLSFPATLAGFEHAAGSLTAALQAAGMDTAARYHVEVVFEEIVANIVRYASPPGRVAAIDVTLDAGAQSIVVTFEDDGMPFDPCGLADPVMPTTLEDAPLGGLGLLLVRRTTTRMHYERTPTQRNRLVVTLAAVPKASTRSL